MLILECRCNECQAEYVLTFDNENFIDPEHCAFCGTLASFDMKVKEK